MCLSIGTLILTACIHSNKPMIKIINGLSLPGAEGRPATTIQPALNVIFTTMTKALRATLNSLRVVSSSITGTIPIQSMVKKTTESLSTKVEVSSSMKMKMALLST